MGLGCYGGRVEEGMGGMDGLGGYFLLGSGIVMQMMYRLTVDGETRSGTGNPYVTSYCPDGISSSNARGYGS